MDRVRPIKIESPSLGGTEEDAEYTPADPQEDALEARGIYVQDASTTDESTLITRNGSDMTFKDTANPSGYTLTQLASGGLGILGRAVFSSTGGLVYDSNGNALLKVTN